MASESSSWESTAARKRAAQNAAIEQFLDKVKSTESPDAKVLISAGQTLSPESGVVDINDIEILLEQMGSGAVKAEDLAADYIKRCVLRTVVLARLSCVVVLVLCKVYKHLLFTHFELFKFMER